MREVSLTEAVEHLKQGRVLIYPTETAYALGCDATNQAAVDLIFQIKQRPLKFTLPVIMGNLLMVEHWTMLNEPAKELVKRYWPGPLTLILPSRQGLAQGCVAADQTVAVRISGHQIARQLSEKLDRPIVSTSANLSGENEIYSTAELQEKFSQQYSDLCFIEGGNLSPRRPSTIIKVETTGKIQVLRQGEITF